MNITEQVRILTTDVQNPKPDRRSKKLFMQVLIPAGTKIINVVVDPHERQILRLGYKVSELTPEQLEGFRHRYIKVHPLNKRSFMEPDISSNSPLYQVLMDNSEPVKSCMMDWALSRYEHGGAAQMLGKVLDALVDSSVALPLLIGLDKELDRVIEQKLKEDRS